jgi:hypothetical protein
MAERRTFRLIDTDGSEIGFVQIAGDKIADGNRVPTADGQVLSVIEVYDDDDGREGGVAATLVVEA